MVIIWGFIIACIRAFVQAGAGRSLSRVPFSAWNTSLLLGRQACQWWILSVLFAHLIFAIIHSEGQSCWLWILPVTSLPAFWPQCSWKHDQGASLKLHGMRWLLFSQPFQDFSLLSFRLLTVTCLDVDLFVLPKLESVQLLGCMGRRFF